MKLLLRNGLLRSFSAIVTLWLAVTIAFLLARLSGDPVRQIVGENASEVQLEAVRTQLGLDKPLLTQYLSYVGDLATFDLGVSLTYGVSNIELILGRLPYSLLLAGAAILIAVVVGVPLGVLSATREGTWVDRLTSTLTLVGQSAPSFWIGMMAILLFSLHFGWFPAGLALSPASLVLPACTLALPPLAQIARLTRSSMAEVLNAPFVEALRSRGLPRWRITYKHALRNAALPVVTIIGVLAGQLVSLAVVIEVVFSWPGIGSLAVEAAEARDFTLVQSVVVIGAGAFVFMNLAVDMLYTAIDPRTRTGARS